MVKFYVTKKAVEDLSQIWNFEFRRSSELEADKYYLMLISAFVDIANNPNFGKAYNVIGDHLRGYRANRHIVFYQLMDDEDVHICRILHESMELKV
jgi:toxin ParE1/3/4